MACVENIECLGEYCACGDILIPVISPVTGTLQMMAEFNGIKLTRDVPVVMGQGIMVPNIFNENYTHIVSFYNNGSLINETTYSLKIVYCKDHTPYMPTQYTSIIIIGEAGNSITDERISGEIVTGLILNDISKNKGFTVSGATITFTDGTTIEEGETITVIFQ